MPKTLKKYMHVSEIPPYATRIVLDILKQFSCSICNEKYDDVHTHRRKKKKGERCKSQHNQCKQLWDSAGWTKTMLTDGEKLKCRLQ